MDAESLVKTEFERVQELLGKYDKVVIERWNRGAYKGLFFVTIVQNNKIYASEHYNSLLNAIEEAEKKVQYGEYEEF